MGNYLNPGNSGFSGIRNDTYVDKTGLIRLINYSIDTPRRLTCRKLIPALIWQKVFLRHWPMPQHLRDINSL